MVTGIVLLAKVKSAAFTPAMVPEELGFLPYPIQQPPDRHLCFRANVTRQVTRSHVGQQRFDKRHYIVPAGAALRASSNRYFYFSFDAQIASLCFIDSCEIWSCGMGWIILSWTSNR